MYHPYIIDLFVSEILNSTRQYCVELFSPSIRWRVLYMNSNLSQFIAAPRMTWNDKPMTKTPPHRLIRWRIKYNTTYAKSHTSIGQTYQSDREPASHSHVAWDILFTTDLPTQRQSVRRQKLHGMHAYLNDVFVSAAVRWVIFQNPACSSSAPTRPPNTAPAANAPKWKNLQSNHQYTNSKLAKRKCINFYIIQYKFVTAY